MNINLQAQKTVKIGTISKEELKNALQVAGCEFGFYGTELLDHKKFTVSSTENSIDLIALTVDDLGCYKDEVDYSKVELCERGKGRLAIWEAASKLGLQKCPQEVGPQLCLQYKDQPSRESFVIVSDPIPNADNTPCAFTLGIGGGKCELDSAYYADLVERAHCRWSNNVRFIFCLPKEKSKQSVSEE